MHLREDNKIEDPHPPQRCHDPFKNNFVRVTLRYCTERLGQTTRFKQSYVCVCWLMCVCVWMHCDQTPRKIPTYSTKFLIHVNVNGEENDSDPNQILNQTQRPQIWWRFKITLTNPDQTILTLRPVISQNLLRTNVTHLAATVPGYRSFTHGVVIAKIMWNKSLFYMIKRSSKVILWLKNNNPFTTRPLSRGPYWTSLWWYGIWTDRPGEAAW